jgi:hypothetical protein
MLNYNKTLKIINQVFNPANLHRQTSMKFTKLFPDLPSVMAVKNGSFELWMNAISQLLR